MIPGMKDLPLSMQVIFWAGGILFAAVIWIAVFFVKRYIEGQDVTLRVHETKMGAVSTSLEQVSKELKDVSVMTIAEFNSFRREILSLNEGMRTDTKKFIRVLATESRKLDQSLVRLKNLEENQDRISTVVKSLSERIFQRHEPSSEELFETEKERSL